MSFGDFCIGGDAFWTIARKDVKARRFKQVTVLGASKARELRSDSG
ncbi:hypothetical protein [Streptomyces nitrosporeus]